MSGVKTQPGRRPEFEARPIDGNGVYERVKTKIITQELRPGKRILVEPLAEQLFVSATPVREALIRLAAERIVRDMPKSGFFTKELSELEIRGLYVIQNVLLDWSVSAIVTQDKRPVMLKPPDLLKDIPDGAAISPNSAVVIENKLFDHIARQSGNADIVRIISNINDRLHYVRNRDYEFFDAARTTLLQMCGSYHNVELIRVQEDLKTFCNGARERLADIIRLARNVEANGAA